MKNILVIPDVHVLSEDDYERLHYLGKLIAARQPDVVVQLGDFADMHSLSSYDSSLSKAEVVGDYWAEVGVVNGGLAVLFEETRKLQHSQRLGKRKIYNPKTILTLGNHDAGRYARVIEKDPIVLGKSISWEDLEYKDYFDVVVPYKEYHEEQGVFFSHFVTNMMGRPLGGGVNPARTILNHTKRSTVVGHSHTYDYSTTADIAGKRIHSLVAGCFVAGREFAYAKGSQHNWVDGVTFLNGAEDGDYDIEFISTTRILDDNY